MNNYPYTSGILKSLENGLLDRQKLQKMALNSSEAFIQTLHELDYGSGSNIETIINSEMFKVKELIDSLSPNKKLTDLFYIVSDAQNIKVLYKKKLFKSSNLYNTSILVNTGSIEKTSLEEAILNDDYHLLSKVAQKLIKLLNNSCKELDNARLLSSSIDNTIYQFALNEAKNSKCLNTYFKTLIDFTNVISMIRSHNLGWETSKYQEMILENGTIKTKFLIDNYNLWHDKKNFDLMIKNFNNYYQEHISKIIKEYHTDNNLNRLETKFDALLMSIMSEYKNDAFDIGPMVYYFLEKSAEAKNIRMLYANPNVDIFDLLEY